mmetsp:Transcript_7994/g.22915  ORF Transcript_7994/g.22915 Transcript_7994/m.22915 type:complete len:310 (+) Transcript_7994:1343-2272(+)
MGRKLAQKVQKGKVQFASFGDVCQAVITEQDLEGGGKAAVVDRSCSCEGRRPVPVMAATHHRLETGRHLAQRGRHAAVLLHLSRRHALAVDGRDPLGAAAVASTEADAAGPSAHRVAARATGPLLPLQPLLRLLLHELGQADDVRLEEKRCARRRFQAPMRVPPGQQRLGGGGLEEERPRGAQAGAAAFCDAHVCDGTALRRGEADGTAESGELLGGGGVAVRLWRHSEERLAAGGPGIVVAKHVSAHGRLELWKGGGVELPHRHHGTCSATGWTAHSRPLGQLDKAHRPAVCHHDIGQARFPFWVRVE